MQKNDLQITYQDTDVMVIEKQANQVVDKSNTQIENTIEDILKLKYSINLARSGIVHRLDKDTSGLLLVAKTPKALENLTLQFKNREVKKEYTCLVHGFIEDEGVVEGGIERNPLNREKFIVSESGKEAITRYQPIKLLVMSDMSIENIYADYSKIQLKKLQTMNYKQFTLLKCFPQTGRTHQIRVHLKHINHPIVSDDKYGGRKINRLDHRWCSRQFLHACKIEFKHPASGDTMIFESVLPDDLQKALSKLEQV